MNIGVISLGCPKNLTDTETMLSLLTASGHRVVAEVEQADCVIINTCTFIASATEESEREIRKLCKLKRERPFRIVLAGCLVQRERDALKQRFPDIDAVIGVNEIGQITSVVAGIEQDAQSISVPLPPLQRLIATPSYTAYLRIADGCDRHCTYCIIPSLRGSYRSQPMETLVAEAKALASRGVKELVIIAQDTTDYGMDLYGEPMLTPLLEQLEAVAGIHWIRLLYAYPEGVSKKLVQFFNKSAKICHYLDIPVQHASDPVLKRMGRQCTQAQIRNVITQLREAAPDIALRTTLIVGFPGETDNDIDQLCEFLKEVKFDRAGIFMYSREKGTPAYKMNGQVEPKVKRQRLMRVRQCQAVISRMVNKTYSGKQMDVLFTSSNGGRSFRDAPEIDGMVFCPNTFEAGTFHSVHICKTLTHDLKGCLVESG